MCADMCAVGGGRIQVSLSLGADAVFEYLPGAPALSARARARALSSQPPVRLVVKVAPSPQPFRAAGRATRAAREPTDPPTSSAARAYALTWLSLSLRAAQGGDVVMFHGGHLPHRVVGTTAGTTTPAFRAMCGGAGFDRINMQVSAKRERERERERGREALVLSQLLGGAKRISWASGPES